MTGRGPARPLAFFLVLVTGAVAVEAVLLIGSTQGPYWVLMTLPATGLVYAAVGTLAWIRRPGNGTGALFCAGAVVWVVAGLGNTDHPALIAASQLVATVPVAFVLHALLAFPAGRLTTRPARVLTAAGYVLTTVVSAAQYMFTAMTPPHDPLLVADRPDVLAVLNPAITVATVALVLATAAVLVHRLVTGAPRTRRTLGPVYAYGAVAVVGVWGLLPVMQWLDAPPLVPPLVQISLLAFVPVAFVAGVLRGGFARTQELQELATTLGREPVGRAELATALARTLGDPSARLLYRVPAPTADSASAEWVDASGTPAGPSGPGRARVPIEVGERTVGAVDYDATLFADDADVRAACGVVALAVDHERLTVELLAGRVQLRESRLRLLEAGDRERRHLAQDLHDRLQSRLVLLAIAADGPDGRDVVRRGLDESIDELRRIVQGVMPALLLERGLAAAVRDLADRSPLPVDLDIDACVGRDLPAPVESTAYRVVAEAVTNAVKHACAARLSIGLRHDGDTLHVQVGDDGVGGAEPTGTGLQGTIDRVTALEGTVRLDSPPGQGTRLVVELPCAS